VRLDNINLDLKAGEITINGFRVGNPSGYSDAEAVSFGKIFVKIAPQALGETGPIVVDHVTIENPHISYEVAMTGVSNFQQISNNAQSYARQDRAQPTSDAQKDSGQTEARKIAIRKLEIKKGDAIIIHQLAQGKTLKADLPEINMTNIGQAQGATPAEIARQLVGMITQVASTLATKELASEFGGAKNPKEGLDKLKGLLGR
jgi:uncharacterized protein involved in outer membrane biogenesis